MGTIEPGFLSLPITRGNAVGFSLDFFDEVTDEPLDMSGNGPFTATVRHSSRSAIITTVVVTIDDDLTNRLNFSILAADTANLIPGTYQWSMVDADLIPWLAGPAVVGKAITEEGF